MWSRRVFLTGSLGFTTAFLLPQGASAQSSLPRRPQQSHSVRNEGAYSNNELIDSGHQFFGTITRGLAQVIEAATQRFGQPNAYILGQEGSGAFIGGLRYGEGNLYTRNAGDRKVYWQGPSLGFDAGGDGDRTMMLVYRLTRVDAIYDRFSGIDGSAYLVGGFGFTALQANNIVIVPIRTGLGARLGVNIGYLKFTPEGDWNPF